MIHILLVILKIIGIILLTVIGFILGLAILVLFVPIRYRADASLSGKTMLATCRISWLLQIISVTASYKDQFNLIIRIFGIPLYDAAKKAKKKAYKDAVKAEKTIKRKTEKAIKKAGEEIAQPILKPLNEIAEDIGELAEPIDEELSVTGEGGDENEKQAGEDTLEADRGGQETAEESGSDGSKDRLPGFLERIRLFFKKMWNRFLSLLDQCRKIKATAEVFSQRIEEIKNKIRYYKELFQSDIFKKSFELCKRQLLRFWRSIRPRRFLLGLHVGLGDPAATGQLMAVYGMLYPFYTSHVQINPEFEDVLLEGELYIKGRITLVVIIRAALIIFFDKNIRKFLALLKKEEV